MGDPPQPSVRSSANVQPGAEVPHVVLRDAGQAITDLVLFAPIGFLKRARTLLPELVREGKATAASAQMIGKFAVPLLRRQGEKVIKRSIADLRGSPSGAGTESNAATPSPAVLNDGPTDDALSQRATTKAAGKASNRPTKRAPNKPVQQASKNPRKGQTKVPSNTTSAATGNGAEPFAGYDLLGSAAVVARLDELTQRQRTAVRAYELGHRNRRTVLGRIDQLEFTSPPA